MRTLFAVVAASVIMASSAAAQSVAGDWNASYDTPGGPKAFKLALVVDGEKLTGQVIRNTGPIALVGTVKGDSVKFTYDIDYNGHPLQMIILAKVTGDSMTGIVDFAGQAQENFAARKAASTTKTPDPVLRD